MDTHMNDLTDKVERLLNSGSDDNLIKPSDEFANLIMHLEEIKTDEKKKVILPKYFVNE